MRKYQIKYLAKLNAIENKFAKIYRKEIKRFNKEAFEMAIYSASVPDYLVKKHQEIMQKILEDHDTLTINRFAGLVFNEFIIPALQKQSEVRLKAIGLLKSVGNLAALEFSTIAYDQLIKERIIKETKADLNLSALEAARRFILSNSLSQSSLIAETSKKKVQKAIAKGYELGESIDDIAKRIRAVDAVAFSRSYTIARTETHNASTYASSEIIKAGQDAYGLVYNKSWVVSIDGRERPAHLAMATHPSIPMDAKFFVGGEYLDRPGDPNGSAENIMQCRCVEIYELQNNS